MRYKGQSFEIDTQVDTEALRRGDLVAFGAAFHEEHTRLYGHCDPAAAVQVVSLRLVISADTPKPRLQTIALGSGEPSILRYIRVWLDGDWHEAPLYRRHDLLAGHRFSGPAVIAQDDTTTCVLPGFSGRVDQYGTLILKNAHLEA